MVIRPLLVLAVLMAIGAIVRGPLSTGAHFMAKRHCSSWFLTGMVPVREFSLPIFRFLPLWVAYSHNHVVVKLFGTIPLARAWYHGPDEGCVLEQPAPSIVCQAEKGNDGAPEPLPREKKEAVQSLMERRMEATLENGEEVHARALVVVWRGVIVAETYRAPFDKSTKQHGWSMTKSLLNSLVGKRVAEGKFALEHAVVWPNGTHSSNGLLVGHLLNMTSGLDWEEDYGPRGDPTVMLHHVRDMIAFVADRGVKHAPGTHWDYSSGDSNLLGYQLSRTFGSMCEYRAWVKRSLRRMGMPGVVLECDGAGNYAWSSYGWATPREWAQWAWLNLNSTWTRQTSQLVDVSLTTGKKKPYAQHFWKRSSDPAAPYFAAEGFEFQFILFEPHEETVVVQLAATRPDRVLLHKDEYQLKLLLDIRDALSKHSS